MNSEKFYSVRMRAAQNGAHEEGGKHISGGELLTTFSGIKQAVNALLEKGLSHSRGIPDFMRLQFECITEPIQLVSPLRVETFAADTAESGQRLAKQLLEQAGVPQKTIKKAYELLPACSRMRGAMLIDIHSGDRADGRGEKGVRVSRMDWKDVNYHKWANRFQLPANSRMKEALVLAAKAARHPAVIAELCWSDDPDYITGYVASKAMGYQRITKLKNAGDEHGLRIFFVDALSDLNELMHYLEKQPVFIHWEEEFSSENSPYEF